MSMPPAPTLVAPAESTPVTVVSVPADHPYVRRVTAAPGITVSPDPEVPGRAAGVWWPPAALSPEWIDANAAAADLLHVHFGTESFAPGHLTRCIAAAHRAGWPVVFTVHDLDHPQLAEQAGYRRQLDELVTGADGLVTLTSGAADAVRRRWGRDAAVIPHPSVLTSHADIPQVPRSTTMRVGVHLKDLRANVDGPGTVSALLAALERLGARGLDVIGEVRLHRAVRDERSRDEVRRLCADDESVELIEHERLSDAELTAALSRLDACVLPYRHGTHSGWLELCWDLGVAVVSPDIGHYLEQHRDGTVAGFAPGSTTSLTSALGDVLDPDVHARRGSVRRTALTASRQMARTRTDAAAAAAHAALYRGLIAERVA
ncbi:glycosyltransferase [Planococcus sp. APC 4015]|nr:glycosyltransferase [Planococcus sp. APC 4015]